jgi:hypothetical protein
MAESILDVLLRVIRAVNGVKQASGQNFDGTIIVLVTCPEANQAAVRAAIDKFKEQHAGQVRDIRPNFKER